MDIAKGKQSDIVQHCIYEIATGKWPQGMKVPSVREAEKMWGVNRLTVLSAYRNLEQIGLLVAKDRSGYYVKGEDKLDGQAAELQELYLKFKIFLSKNSNYHTGYILKYFDRLFFSESKNEPRYAFLECTDYQAADHANEIFERLNVYIKPICIPDEPSLIEIPGSVEVLLTTGFHIEEVKEIGKKFDKKVELVPIEIDPTLLHKVASNIQNVIFLEREGHMSNSILNDLKNLNLNVNIVGKVVSDIEIELPEIMDDKKNELVLLSPRLWGRTSPGLRRSKKIQAVRFRISTDAWKKTSHIFNVPHSTR